MFEVYARKELEYYKQEYTPIKVYKIRNDSCGFPLFLVFENNQWRWKSAKHYVPTLENLRRLRG